MLVDFWEMPEKLWGQGSWQAELVADYRTAPTREVQAAIIAQVPSLRFLLRTLRFSQDNMRQQQPEIDRLLVKYYDYAPTPTWAGSSQLLDRRLPVCLRG